MHWMLVCVCMDTGMWRFWAKNVRNPSMASVLGCAMRWFTLFFFSLPRHVCFVGIPLAWHIWLVCLLHTKKRVHTSANWIVVQTRHSGHQHWTAAGLHDHHWKSVWERKRDATQRSKCYEYKKKTAGVHVITAVAVAGLASVAKRTTDHTAYAMRVESTVSVWWWKPMQNIDLRIHGQHGI